MPERPLKILQVNTFDLGGGAEKVAWNLFRTYRELGNSSWLAVGHKIGTDPDVLPIPNPRRAGKLARLGWRIHAELQSQGGNSGSMSSLAGLVHFLIEPGKAFDQHWGIEDFRFPGSWKLLDLIPGPPDILHCHNLHGRYFDLRLLPWLSRQVPLVLTLHDTWQISGHCAYSMGCERWKTGCGACPDLNIPPAARRDATAFNWRRKREIYSKSRLFVATPSRWLMDQVEQSILAPAVAEARVIPNGVDRSVFHPTDRQAARARLAIPSGAKVILFAANTIRGNYFKDYPTLKAAITRLSDCMNGENVLFLALGESAPAEHIGQAEIRFLPFQSDSEVVAAYYQAADVYAHAARADTFPNTILEAMACGLPVVATAVGGIPEQVVDGQTGFLVHPGDSRSMAECIHALLSNGTLYQLQSQQATETARQRFDLQKQAGFYLDWYHTIKPAGMNRKGNQESHALPEP